MRRVRSEFLQSLTRAGGRAGPLTVSIASVLAAVLVAGPFAASAHAESRAFLGSFGTSTGEGAGDVTTGKGIASNVDGAGGVTAGSVYVADDGNSRIDQFSPSGSFVRTFGWDVVASGSGDVGPNETQSVTVRATGGAYTLTVTTATALGTTTSGSTTLTKVSGGLGQFRVGDAISGTGIPANTTVTCVSPSPGCTAAGTITISQAATSTGDNRALTGRETTAAIAATATSAGAGSVEEALTALPGVGASGVTVTGGPGDATGTSPYSITFSGGPLAHDDVAPMTGTSSAGNPLSGGSPTGVTVATTTPGGGPEVCNAPGALCKAGTASASAGSVSGAEAVAVDQATGNVFVASNANRRIDVFSAQGSFQGAFGRGVTTGGTALEFCTSTCSAGVAAVTAGAFGTNGLTQAALTVSPDGAVYVGDRVNRRINEFALTHNGSDAVTAVSFTRAFGWGVRDGSAALQTCTTATACVAANTTGGNGDGQFPANTPTSVAVDEDGLVYAVTSAGTCAAATNPCRVQVFNPDGTFKENFGPSTGGNDACQLTWNSGHWGAQAPNGVAVDTATGHVFVTRKDSTTGNLNGSAGTFEVCEFDADGTFLFRSPPVSLATNNNGYLRIAFGAGDEVLVSAPIVATTEGAISILGEVPPPGAAILPATDVGQTTATLNGTVTVPAPGGDGFEPRYRFEYSADNGLTWVRVPTPDALLGTDDAGPENVTGQITGLEPNRTYRVRLIASTSTTTTSTETTFTTDAAKPTVKFLHVLPIGHDSGTLRGTLNPNNSPTNYYFEYGTTANYGKQAPAFEPYIGDHGADQKVSVAIDGLSPNTTYHYRLVATNETGTTFGPDKTFKTNAAPCQGYTLPNCRAYELVSPANAAPLGAADWYVNATHPGTQVAISPDGQRVAYVLANALPDSEAAGDANFLATRTDGGWTSRLQTPPSEREALPASPSAVSALELRGSPDLRCGVVSSGQPLADDAPSETADAGGVNLFRRNPDGSYTTMTTAVPTNPRPEGDPAQTYEVFGLNDDCTRVIFATPYDYPGVPNAGAERTVYSWEDGVISNVSMVPGSSGSVPAPDPRVGRQTGFLHAVSRDASRVVFTATSQEGDDLNKVAVFVNDDGETINVSRSQTTTVNQGAFYQDAAADGSKVFFLANYGLTGPVTGSAPTNTNCSIRAQGDVAVGGCDLYEYDLQSGDLTNLSASSDSANPQGAQVEGVLDASDDGEYVYFVARGQLAPGEGRTYSENLAGDGSFNVYLAHDGDLSFVAVVPRQDVMAAQPSPTLASPGLLTTPRGTGATQYWTADATPDGRHLLFQTSGDATSFEGEGTVQAFRYSADAGAVTCVSCRRDGAAPESLPTTTGTRLTPLTSRRSADVPNYFTSPRSISDDGSRIYFRSADALAPGGVDGNYNLYQWESGEVSLLATEPIDVGAVDGSETVRFMGASTNGDTVFLSTEQRLVPDDRDDLRSVYAVRVNGGFPSAPAPPMACSELDDKCQGAGAAPVASESRTGGPSGAGNAVVQRISLSLLNVRAAARRRAARRGLLRIEARATAPGAVRFRATARIRSRTRVVATGTKRLDRAGPAVVVLRLSRAARQRLAEGEPLRVSVTASMPGALPVSVGVRLRKGTR
jgi:hypothetical protein